MKGILLILSFFLPFACLAQTFSGTIIKVIDGDTFVFQTEEGSLQIRMHGIDAPEKSQEYGLESKAFMEKYLHKSGTLNRTGIDKYGRSLAVLFIEKVNINLESIKNGCSWHYRQYSKDNDYSQAEIQAKGQKMGLWQYPNPIPPWEYRRLAR